MMQSEGKTEGKSRRGFASMSPEKRREIARRGGKAAHEKGRAHEFTPEEARAAGRKGGLTVSLSREHMARIGRAGGQARRRRAGDDDRGTEVVLRAIGGVRFPIDKEALLRHVDNVTVEIRRGEPTALRPTIERIAKELWQTAEEVAEEVVRAVGGESRAA
jgi:uncharacterized protein